MLSVLTETSIVSMFLRHVFRTYRSAICRLSIIYLDSYAYSLKKSFCDTLRVSFKNSLIDRVVQIAEIAPGKSYAILLEESRFIGWLLSLYGRAKGGISSYLGSSITAASVRDIKEVLLLSLNTVSIIVVIATALNLSFSLSLKKEIALLQWVISCFLLLIGLGGLFSNAKWQDIRQTSWVVRKGSVI